MYHSPLDVRVARFRFDDETEVGLGKLEEARARWNDAYQARTFHRMSVRAGNALHTLGIVSKVELRQALKKTPSLLSYINQCGPITRCELLRWADMKVDRIKCPHCRGTGIVQP
jgi:hypothetical protein